MASKFRVLICGYDPTAGLMKNGEPRIGFWTTRYVEAADESEAEQKAMSLVRGEERLAKVVTKEWGATPVLSATEVEQLESFGDKAPGAGYTFFEEADDPS